MDVMDGLIGIHYPNLTAAKSALDDLFQLQKEMLIELDDAVILEMRGEGKVKLHQTSGSTGAGAASGALWGGLIGLLLFAPLLGMAFGAAGGAAASAATDTGIDDEFLKNLGSRLEPGNAALVVLVRKSVPDKVLQRLHGQHDGEIIHTSLSTEDEHQLKLAAEAARLKYGRN
jgi:uncharacterized membrane protein